MEEENHIRVFEEDDLAMSDYLLKLRIELGSITLEKIKELGKEYLSFYERHKDWKP